MLINQEAGLGRKSARFLARKNDCDKKTIYNIIHNDLGLKSYRRIRCQALTDAHRLKRRQFCTWVRKNISKDQLQKIMFSDEKMFNEDDQINYKNEIIYAESREEANKIGGLREEHKYPMSVMVWCGITWNGATKVVVLPPKTSFNEHFYS